MSRLECALAVILSITLCASAQATDRIFLIYDEQQIGDADRAVLLDALCYAVDPEDWRPVVVPFATNLNGVVDRYYDYWDNPSKEENPFPLSMAAIARHIAEENRDVVLPDGGVPEGAELRIPPLPVRGEWRNEEDIRVRLYDPKRRAYEKLPALPEVMPMATQRTNALADKNHPFRHARLTVFEIPDWEKFAEKLDRAKVKNPADLPAGAVLVRGEQRLVPLELLEHCEPNSSDAFAPGVAEELATFRAELPQRLAKQPIPLWIVDWNIDVPGGHGKKVLSVVYAVLEQLGLCELKDYVKPFDLNPHNNGPELERTLTLYRNIYESKANLDQKTAPIIFATAKAWITNPDPALKTADAESVKINEYVLQAVLARFLYGQPTWVNMSFTLKYPQAQLLNAMYLDRDKPSTFAFVAAGNDPNTKVSNGAFPQSGAANYPNIVNVTFGGDDGTVKGAKTRDSDVGVPVHLVARGCFKTSASNEEFCGSSFASPYVAVTAWLRYLFAGTLPADMRRTLRYATKPSSFQQKLVETRGIYEPALLFASPGDTPYVSTLSGQHISIPGARIHVEFIPTAEAAAPEVNEPAVEAALPSVALRRLAVVNCDWAQSGFCVWMDRGKYDGTPDIYPLVAFSVTGGGEVDHWTMAEHASRGAVLWY